MIENAKGAPPRNLTDRDKAYVLELYERFGEEEFDLYRFKKVYLADRIANRFNVKSGRVDDAGMIGNRLPRHGFLTTHRAGKYQLTAAAVNLALELASSPRNEEAEKTNG